MAFFPRSKRRQGRRARAEALSSVPDSAFRTLAIDRRAVAELELGFDGTLVWPWSPEYDKDRQESNPAFQAYPQLIAYCETVVAVASALKYATDRDLKVACRSGGHSTAGFSVNDGVVIDMSRINFVVVAPERNTATVGAGVNFGRLNSVLDFYKLHVPGGGCEDVCVGGYMQGGGYGFTSREFGMNCDNVSSVRVMTPDGQCHFANAENCSDLYWGIRGGTGNNFGVLLEVTYNLRNLWQVWAFGIRWSLADAPAALLMMQQRYMRTGAASRLGYMTVITLQEDGNQWLLMRGMYDGPAVEGRQALAPLLATPGASLEIDKVGSYYEMNHLLLEQTPYEIPYIPPLPPNATVKEDKQAGYIATPVPLAHWQRVIEFYRRTPTRFNTVVIEPYGGAINSYPAFPGNAFVHRDVDMDFFVDTFWVDDNDRQRAVAWLDEFMRLMTPYFNGKVYQNYPRRGTPNYRSAYWGNAFPRLLEYKLNYNKGHMFDYEQSISPGPFEATAEPGAEAAMPAPPPPEPEP